MIYRKFKDLDISMLGFGLMRLPLNEDKTIDKELTAEMVDYAMKHGINYYDTAWPYHNGESETVIGDILKNYPRESFYLADKYPGHVVAEEYTPKETFEKQLAKCQVDYFDFYLLHNVCENSIGVYEDPRWDIFNYFIEQKKHGRIKHLGFSSHADLPKLKEILDKYGKDVEFIQLQINYFDWTVQKAKEKYDMVAKYDMPIIVMEPVRGGKLASLPEEFTNRLKSVRPDASDASYALRWLQGLDNVLTVLSGMSNMEQLVENINTFEKPDPLDEEEEGIVMAAAEALKNEVPCTACRYCVDSCPMELDIPDLLFKYNQLRAGSALTISMQVNAIPEDKRASACIGCGACMEMCPQHIAIPDELAAFSEELAKNPSWAEICRQREEAAKKLEEQGKA